MGDFTAHIGTDTDAWKGVIGKHRVIGLNDNEDIYCNFVVATDSAS